MRCFIVRALLSVELSISCSSAGVILIADVPLRDDQKLELLMDKGPNGIIMSRRRLYCVEFALVSTEVVCKVEFLEFKIFRWRW
jgi:hypothetical protein